MSNRLEKANSVLKRCLSEIISNKLNDPRLEGSLVSVSSVDISSDLKYAKVYLSLFCPKKNEEEVFNAIISASSYIKKSLAPMAKMRNVPQIVFDVDTSAEYSEKIAKILKNIID